jgi:hypothetical protein
MKEKEFILGEIRRTAAINNNKPLGQTAFLAETCVTEHEWKGVYWARWGDALVEAGFEPLEWNPALDEEEIFKHLASLVRKYQKYPAKAEIQMESRSNKSVPVPTTLRRRLGEKAEIIRKLRDYCLSKEEYTDVVAILAKEVASVKPIRNHSEQAASSKNQLPTGYVYLVKSGKLYKIGYSENHWRRKSELHKQTAEGITEIHTIAAIDDAPGIEKYWHNRFSEQRQHGEWFNLSAEDISAFKKRKFM